MFIELKRIKTYWILLVKDNKDYLLHYFEKELESLKLVSPIVVFIAVDSTDRKGYRIKLVKLFKKINKLTNYTCYICNSDEINELLKNNNY